MRTNQSDEKQAGTGWMIAVPVTLGLVCSVIALIWAGNLDYGFLKVVLAVTGGLFLLGTLASIFRTADFSKLVNGTPRQLAYIRILVCGIAFVLTAVENFPAIARMPAQFRRRDQLFYLLNLLPGYTTLVSSSVNLAILQWTTAVLLFMALIGFKTRITLVLGTVGFFLMQAILRQHIYFFHSGILPLYLLLLLAWMPCAGAWSIDQWCNPKKTEASARLLGLSVYVCYAVVALIYLISGLSKLRDSGLGWLNADSIQHYLIQDAMRPIFLDYDWKASLWLTQHDAPGWIYNVIGIVGLGTELGYISVLFSRTARRVMPVMAVAVHVGILVFQHILFLDLILLQLIFVNADGLAAFGRRVARSRGLQEDLELRPNLPDEWRGLAAASMGVVIAGLFVAWAFRVNSFPVSDWHMYSTRQGRTPVIYHKVTATLEDGRVVVVPRRDYFPAVMPNHASTVEKAFYSSWRASFDKFMSSVVEHRNRKLAPGERMVSVEVQRWRWNYAVDPHDPRFGWMTDRYIYDAPAKSR